MGKPGGKASRAAKGKTNDASPDKDVNVFIELSTELKEEGNKQFQKREYEAAILKYEKAVNLLPEDHTNLAYLHSNLAACYMEMRSPDYNHAIRECNLALEASPKYVKALLKRARCYEALSKLDRALRDVNIVLTLEPNNITAMDILERVKREAKKQGNRLDVQVVFKEKEKVSRRSCQTNPCTIDEEVVEKAVGTAEGSKRVVKLVLGDDIRWAELPMECSALQLRDIVLNQFPNAKAVLIKYKDREGDLMTITRTEELRWAEESTDPSTSLKLYITHVHAEQDPLTPEAKKCMRTQNLMRNEDHLSEKSDGKQEKKIRHAHIDRWVDQFAQIFENYLGSEDFANLQVTGMKKYSEVVEDVVTSKEAQEILGSVEHDFQEMAALALFNLGNVQMSRAQKILSFPNDASLESEPPYAMDAYEQAKEEYGKAAERYREAVRIDPNFYQGFIALGKEQYEQAKLSWFFALGTKADLHKWPSSEIFTLLNQAESNMKRGMDIWIEGRNHLKNTSKASGIKDHIYSTALNNLFRNAEAGGDENEIGSQINLLWGSILYERSIMEIKLGISIWKQHLLAAIDKFRFAESSTSYITGLMERHCSSETIQEGLRFQIDEVLHAQDEAHQRRRLKNGIPPQLRPLL